MSLTLTRHSQRCCVPLSSFLFLLFGVWLESAGVFHVSRLMALSSPVEAGGIVAFLSGVLGADKGCVVDFVYFVPEMKARHPLWTFLQLRRTCRGMVWPCIVAMRLRALFLWKSLHDRPAQLRRLGCFLESGILHQMWAPTCPNVVRRELSTRRRDLIFDARTLRPFGMSERYWRALLERLGTRGHGWIDGRLHL